jgi:hypothetical protein
MGKEAQDWGCGWTNGRQWHQEVTDVLRVHPGPPSLFLCSTLKFLWHADHYPTDYTHTHHHIPEDSNLRSHHHENVKSCTEMNINHKSTTLKQNKGVQKTMLEHKYEMKSCIYTFILTWLWVGFAWCPPRHCFNCVCHRITKQFQQGENQFTSCKPTSYATKNYQLWHRYSHQCTEHCPSYRNTMC